MYQKKPSEMCSPVKGSASNDNSTAVIQKQINPARMKNQWALRNSDNEKVSLPVRSSGEAPLTEQPSAFSCLLRTVQHSRYFLHQRKDIHNWANRPKTWGGIILDDTEGSQKTVFKTKPKQIQHSILKPEKEFLAARTISSARETDEFGRPGAWSQLRSHWWNRLFTRREIKHLGKFFRKIIWHSSGQKI